MFHLNSLSALKRGRQRHSPFSKMRQQQQSSRLLNLEKKRSDRDHLSKQARVATISALRLNLSLDNNSNILSTSSSSATISAAAAAAESPYVAATPSSSRAASVPSAEMFSSSSPSYTPSPTFPADSMLSPSYSPTSPSFMQLRSLVILPSPSPSSGSQASSPRHPRAHVSVSADPNWVFAAPSSPLSAPDIIAKHKHNRSQSSKGSAVYDATACRILLLSGYYHLPHLFYPGKVLYKSDIIPLFYDSAMSSKCAKKVVQLWNNFKIGACHMCYEMCQTEKFYSENHLPICYGCREKEKKTVEKNIDSLLTANGKFSTIYENLSKRVGWCNQCSRIAYGFVHDGSELRCYACENESVRLFGHCSSAHAFGFAACDESSDNRCFFCKSTTKEEYERRPENADMLATSRLRAKIMMVSEAAVQEALGKDPRSFKHVLLDNIMLKIRSDRSLAPFIKS